MQFKDSCLLTFTDLKRICLINATLITTNLVSLIFFSEEIYINKNLKLLVFTGCLTGNSQNIQTQCSLFVQVKPVN